MRSIIINGLFIVLICSISTRLIKATPTDDYDDYYTDDADLDENYPAYDDDPTTEANEPATKIITTLVHNVTEEEIPLKVSGIQEDKIEPVQSVKIGETEVFQHDDCPKWCTCDEQLQFIDCSNRSLIGIPKNLPNTSIHLNLSSNDIKEIQENDLSNLTVVRQIILTNNKIENINPNVFKSLHRLDSLDLSSNNISKIDPDLFQHVQGLSLLTLNNNPITFEANQTFLNLPNLEILNLVGCNITVLYNETFMNLTGLSSLNLANNSIIEDINVDAFNPLNSLLKLKIPHVLKTATYGLCEKISVIDVISFDKYNISCYELISGSSYEESTITHGPTVQVEKTTKPMRLASTENVPIEVKTDVSTKDPKLNVTETPESIYENEEATTTADPFNKTIENVKSEKVEKSSQSIKTILIASIIIAVFGLIIGLICRKDVFGVKTKLCRTQRPERPEPPTIPELMPLNKV